MTRVVVFTVSHVLLLVVAFHYGANLRAAAATYSLTGTIFAALKLLVLVPTIFLFPFNLAFLRAIAPELIATLIVLFTFNPDRYFQLIWPRYSDLLGAGITRASAPFIPNATFTRAADAVVVAGPVVDLHVEFSCSGVNGVGLFQFVFAMIVAVEWNRLSKLRALICYAGGVLVYLMTNFLRLVILYLSSNLVSRTINLSVAEALAIALFTLTFIAIMLISYEWMVPKEPVPIRLAGPA